jgi:hypothetical protein
MATLWPYWMMVANHSLVEATNWYLSSQDFGIPQVEAVIIAISNFFGDSWD